MGRKTSRFDPASLAAGAAIGAGAAVLANWLMGRDPQGLPGQRRVNRALSRALDQVRRDGPIRLEGDYQYIIFSDHHKGARNAADDFEQCEATYLTALDHYDRLGHTLIILGDGEELLEEPIPAVIEAYRNVLEREARFHPDRLVRIVGNHDDAWGVRQMVEQYMQPIFPGLEYRQALLFEVPGAGGGQPGEVFLAHGHQGSLDADIFAFLAKYVLPYYRDFQILTRSGRTLPSQDDCLRSLYDNRMYRWASQQPRLILIAGHTHRPVWSSQTHLEKLVGQLRRLQELDPAARPPDYVAQEAALRAEIDLRRAKFPPCNDIVKTRPSYFNSGCCRFADGDITGIEIENGLIRLIKWGQSGGSIQRVMLEEAPLAEIFYLL